MKILALPLFFMASPAMAYGCYNYTTDEVAVIEDENIIGNIDLLVLTLLNSHVSPGVYNDNGTMMFVSIVNESPVLMTYSNEGGLIACGEDSEIALLSTILDPSL